MSFLHTILDLCGWVFICFIIAYLIIGTMAFVSDVKDYFRSRCATCNTHAKSRVVSIEGAEMYSHATCCACFTTYNKIRVVIK